MRNEATQLREVSAANKPFGRGPRSAAPTRDTAEPALPGRWCRPLEGEAAKPLRGCSIFRVAQGTAKRHGRGSPFLWLLSFGEAKESNSAAGPKPGLSPEKKKQPATQTQQQNPFFAYFLPAKLKKVTRPPGRDPACHRRKTQPANQTQQQNPFFAYFLPAKPKESKSPTGASPSHYCKWLYGPYPASSIYRPLAKRSIVNPAFRGCGWSCAMVWAKHQPDAGVALKPP